MGVLINNMNNCCWSERDKLDINSEDEDKYNSNRDPSRNDIHFGQNKRQAQSRSNIKSTENMSFGTNSAYKTPNKAYDGGIKRGN